MADEPTEDEMTPEEEGVMEALRIIALQIDAGRPLEDIVEELVQGGLEEEKAWELVKTLEAEVQRVREEEEEVVNAIADRLFEGDDPENIISEFVEAGIDEEEARNFVMTIKRDIDTFIEEQEKIEAITQKGIEEGKDLDAIVGEVASELGYDAEDIKPAIEALYNEITAPSEE